MLARYARNRRLADALYQWGLQRPHPLTRRISRATCYRDRQLRAVIDTYRARHGELLTLTGLADRVDQLTASLEAVAGKVRRQEEELRDLKRRTTTRPAPTQQGD